jgi:hypothetical protein
VNSGARSIPYLWAIVEGGGRPGRMAVPLGGEFDLVEVSGKDVEGLAGPGGREWREGLDSGRG